MGNFRGIAPKSRQFTGIAVCMFLVHWSAALGWVELPRLYVNPTLLWSAMVGGVVLGMGFRIGGYCPGTSIVAAATGKIDGMFFVLGVGAGIVVFREGPPLYRDFFRHAGDLGRLRLPEVFGLDGGLVALIACSWRSVCSGGRRSWRRRSAGTGRRAAVLMGVGLALHGEPGPVELAATKKAVLDARLEAREVHLDPAEVLRLLHDRRIPIDLVDLRDEVDFNLVHLVDARRATLDDLADPSRWPPFRPLALKILISNDEGRAEAAWRLLTAAGVRGVYILAGGMNLWVRVFRDGETNAQPQPGEGRLRPTFDAARGASWAFARPDPDAAEGRSFVEKAKPPTTVVELASGCGG